MSGGRTPSGTGWATDPIRAAGGRRRHNRRRQVAALERQLKVAEMMFTFGTARGAQARIARELGVSATTIGNDFRAIFSTNDLVRCPACGTAVPTREVTWSWRPHRPAGSPPLHLVVDEG
jgi:hypothetical protein